MKVSREAADTVSEGKEFQALTILTDKKRFRISSLALGRKILKLCPRVVLLGWLYKKNRQSVKGAIKSEITQKVFILA